MGCVTSNQKTIEDGSCLQNETQPFQGNTNTTIAANMEENTQCNDNDNNKSNHGLTNMHRRQKVTITRRHKNKKTQKHTQNTSSHSHSYLSQPQSQPQSHLQSQPANTTMHGSRNTHTQTFYAHTTEMKIGIHYMPSTLAETHGRYSRLIQTQYLRCINDITHAMLKAEHTKRQNEMRRQEMMKAQQYFKAFQQKQILYATNHNLNHNAMSGKLKKFQRNNAFVVTERLDCSNLDIISCLDKFSLNKTSMEQQKDDTRMVDATHEVLLEELWLKKSKKNINISKVCWFFLFSFFCFFFTFFFIFFFFLEKSQLKKK